MANDGVSDRVETDRDKLDQVNENGQNGDDSVGEIPFCCVNVVGNSRVRSEFEVLQSLGKGGFGSVVKVCHEFWWLTGHHLDLSARVVARGGGGGDTPAASELSAK